MIGFNKLFWGFLFVALDFRINTFDIIPDIIGYWMIYAGLKDLENWNYHFQEAKKYSIILGFISILDIFQINRPLNEVSFEPMIIASLLIGIGLAVIDLFMVYNICLGISELAEKREFVELSEKAMGRWRLYLYAKAASIVLFPIVFVSPGLAVVLALPLVVFGLIVGFMMVFLMREADNYFSSITM